MDELRHFDHLPSCGLYIHIPWCIRKCPYCDFNSHASLRTHIPWQEYHDALIRDLCYRLPDIWQRRFHTIFLGGGTPSLIAPEHIAILLSELRSLLPISPTAEITMEANPGTLECNILSAYRDAGITRLSLGVQSFQNSSLQKIGRLHTAEEAIVYATQMMQHFETSNIDMMYALPDQNMTLLAADLEQLCTLHPPHISYYHLTIEPNTTFAVQRPKHLPSHDDSADMMELIHQTLFAHGYQHYETSAYAQKKHQCRHNLNYWQYGDFLGIGAGAASKISFPDGRIFRTLNAKHPRQFIAEAGTAKIFIEQKWLTTADIIFEFALNAFRLTNGFTRQHFTTQTGISFLAIEDMLASAEEKGFIYRNGDHIQPSPKGMNFLNELLMLFLPSQQASPYPQKKATKIITLKS